MLCACSWNRAYRDSSGSKNEYIEVVNDVIFNELCLGNALVGARAGKSDIFVI